MPSALRRTRRRALNLSRSFANAVKSHIFNTFFFGKAPAPARSHPSYTTLSISQPLLIPTNAHAHTCNPPSISKHDIGRPRPVVRRRPPPAYASSNPHFIHRLPVEILSLILVLGSEDDIMLPIVVSHVCTSWRIIALRTPALWRRITFTPHMEVWRERLHRARACSLDIQLLPWYKPRSGIARRQCLDVHTVQWYMHLVVPYIHRWRSLEIQFTDYAPHLWNAALFGCCSRSNKAQALQLEELSLIHPKNDDTKEFCLFSGCAPRLRRVTLDGIRLTWLSSLFGNLTYLDYSHHAFTWGHEAVSEVINMIRVSSQLVELRILFPQKRVTSLPTRSPPINQRIILPRLTHLHVRVDGGGIPLELAHLLSLLNTPSLISLRFIDITRRHHSFPNLTAFFSMYALPRALRIVRIEHGWYDQNLIFPLLYNLPNIRHLVVRRPHAPDMYYDLISRRWRSGNRIEDTYGYTLHHVRRSSARHRQPGPWRR